MRNIQFVLILFASDYDNVIKILQRRAESSFYSKKKAKKLRHRFLAGP